LPINSEVVTAIAAAGEYVDMQASVAQDENPLAE